MQRDNVAKPDQCHVRFFPPLSEQRQAFLLDVLRSHPATSVLDIGCGEGTLLSAICRPSFALSPCPNFDERYSINPDATVKSPADMYPPWNVDRLAGLDIVAEALQAAEEGIRPSMEDSTEYSPYSAPRPRFSHLNVKLWNGGLQYFNEDFRNYDIIFSTEVIEHLPYDILPCFCPMVLGRYAPDVLAITTPNFDFNKLFTPPDAPPFIHPSASPGHKTRSGGILDPTGATIRVFRHPDHKFEWTRDEFSQWCTFNANAWGYQVDISGVGKSIERDPWERDERDEKGGGTLFASQTAVFKRITSDRLEHLARYEESAIATLQAALDKSANGSSENPHELLIEYDHDSHPAIRSDTSTENVLDAVKNVMISNIGCEEADVFDIWNNDEVSTLCHGRLEALYDALIAAGINGYTETKKESLISGMEWEWVDPNNRARWARRVRWIKFPKPKEPNTWDVQKVEDYSWDKVEASKGPLLEEVEWSPRGDNGNGWQLKSESKDWDAWDTTGGWGKSEDSETPYQDGWGRAEGEKDWGWGAAAGWTPEDQNP